MNSLPYTRMDLYCFSNRNQLKTLLKFLRKFLLILLNYIECIMQVFKHRKLKHSHIHESNEGRNFHQYVLQCCSSFHLFISSFSKFIFSLRREKKWTNHLINSNRCELLKIIEKKGHLVLVSQ